MMAIKKIAGVLATVLIVIVRFPMTWILAGFNWIDFNLVKLIVKLAKVIDCDWYKDGLYWVMDVNVRGFERIAEYFEDLQEDLA